MLDIQALAWPVARLGEAVEILARRAGFSVNPPAAPVPSLAHDEQTDNQTLGQWLDTAAGRLGLEAEAVQSPYNEVEHLVSSAGPALLRLPGEGQPRFLVLLKGGRRRVSVITPELSIRRIPPASIRTALTHDMEAPWVEQINQVLTAAGVPEQRLDRARAAILSEQLSGVRIDGCWLLRLSPAVNFWQQMRHAQIPRYVLTLAAAHVIQQGLQIVGWWLIVQGALQGHFDRAWLLAWGLVLLTSIPFQVLMTWTQSLIAIGAGGLFKQRLLHGALQLEPEEVRHQGIGQFLGRVMESEALESLVLGGGFTAATALVELAAAIVILNLGAGGGLHALLLLLWVLLTLFIGWRYYLCGRDWSNSHGNMINALVERMVGHRTRLAQEDPRYWHQEEDQSLAGYARLSQRLDSIEVRLKAFFSQGWLIVGLAGIAYSLVTASASPTQLAISLGGILLAAKALHSLVDGMQSLVGVMNAWRRVGPLFKAATRGREAPGGTEQPAPSTGNGQPVVVARDLVFRYRDYGQPVLAGCNLRVARGDRLLLEGPSGGGKSTLAALLTGLRNPASGLLLLQGLDRQTLGTEAWRRRVVAAPQFHENHVLAETFAFNLLMGRRWPPLPEDLEAAETLCRELGLGELLERMPAGFQQTVGESGWQLSHGERSRLYIARALLQQAELIVLDESFAALDPENLERALRCVLKRAPTLLVIAHP